MSKIRVLGSDLSVPIVVSDVVWSCIVKRTMNPIKYKLLAAVLLGWSFYAQAAENNIATGEPVRISRLGIEITPPVGWEIKSSYLGKSLVLQEPKQEKITDYSKPIYQKNITVAVSHESTPIDQIAAERLRNDLIIKLGNQPGVENFRLDGQARFFDYKGSKDGLLVYSFFDFNKIPMTQMHIMVAGEMNKVLLSYTDLSERFEAEVQPAWESMLSVEIVGQAPGRFDGYWQYAAGAASLALLPILFILGRRRRMKKLLHGMDEDFAKDVDLDFGNVKSEVDFATPPVPESKPRIRVGSKGIIEPSSELPTTMVVQQKTTLIPRSKAKTQLAKKEDTMSDIAELTETDQDWTWS